MGPKNLLVDVVRVSASSVFLSPAAGETVAFGTVSSAPPSHRSALQSNGLIAKICITVSKNDVGVVGRALWEHLLVSAGLTTKDVLQIPSELSTVAWPILAAEEYASRVRFFKARRDNENINASTYCAPILSIKELHVSERTLQAHVCVVWMPRYSHDLIAWTQAQLSRGSWVPEASVVKVIRHCVEALHLVRELVVPAFSSTEEPAVSLSGAARKTNSPPRALGCPLNFEMENVLVMMDENSPVFVLTASEMHSQRKLDALAAVSQEDTKQLTLFPYMAPEQVLPNGIPTANAKFDTWALGTIAFNVARGTPSLSSQVQRFTRRNGVDLPLNHPAVTPDQIVHRVRKDLETGSYTNVLTSVLLLMLSMDFRTRPGMSTCLRMLQDVDRPTPIARFPLAIGSYDLLRMPSVEKVQLNLNARKYVTQDNCVLCKSERNLTKCRAKEHTQHVPAVTSPTWATEELLPDMVRPGKSHMIYLYPLVPTVEEKERRRLVANALGGKETLASMNHSHAAPSPSSAENSVNFDVATIDRGSLFQLFGGFGLCDITQRKSEDGKTIPRATLREVLVPYPANALRRSEASWSAMQIHFAGAQPWVSHCTRQLQRKGRITSQIPFMFAGTFKEVKWFAWIAPGETFTLESGLSWTPALNGAFVFWFNSTLEPTSLDRYFPLTSVRGLTLQARLPRTVLPDNVFVRHVERGDLTGHMSAMQSYATVIRSSDRPLSRRGSEMSPDRRRGSAARRRSGVATDMDIPSSRGIVEDAQVTSLNPTSTLGATASARERSKSDSDPRSGQISPRLRNQRPQSSQRQAYRITSIDMENSPGMLSSRTKPLSPRQRTPPEDIPLVNEAALVARQKQRSASRERLPRKSKSPTTSLDNSRGLDSPGSRLESPDLPYEWTRHDENQSAPRTFLKTASGAFSGSTQGSTPSSRATPPTSVPASAPAPASTAATATAPLAAVDKNRQLPKIAGVGKDLRRHSAGDVPVAPKSDRRSSAAAQPAATPPLTVPAQLTPDEAAVLDTQVFGYWCAAELIDAPFLSLTFWVSGTNDHGDMQAPVKMNSAQRSAFRAPAQAAYMCFLSNKSPLFRRNHWHCYQESVEARLLSDRACVLPHHGFAFYTADESLIGFVALRVSLSTHAYQDEFRLPLKPLTSFTGFDEAASRYYASYIGDNWTGEPSPRSQSTANGSADHASLLHSFAGKNGVDKLRQKPTSPAAETRTEALTFSSARKLLGDFTPVSQELYVANVPAQAAPACWMGFDPAMAALVFAPVSQAHWTPLALLS